MRGATQTRKRRVGPRLEFWRGVGRLMIGRTLTFGEPHEGYYSDGQHALLNWSPVLWVGALIGIAIIDLGLVKLWVFGTALICLVFFVLPWVYNRIRGWWQFRGLLSPLSATVGELCGWPSSTRPWLWAHFPYNWRTSPDADIRIEFKYDAANLEEKQKKILDALSKVLGKLDPRYIEWHTDVPQSPIPFTVRWPYLLIRPECPPPDVAMFADHLKRIRKYPKDSQIALGIGCFDRTEVIDIDDDAPHAVIAADSGRGKSSVEALVGCQMANKGAVPVIIDPKIISLQAFKGLPNVAYFAGEEAAHHGLLALKAEMRRRAELIDVPWGVEPPDVGPRLMVLIEEADSLVAELRDWKEDIGEGRSNIRSITAMNRLRNMGRELHINIFIVTQTAGAAALGGAGSQTGFGFQLISANHEGVFKKLAPQVKEIPAQSEHRGRWHLNKPGSGAFPVEIQCFGFPKPARGREHLKFAEAREYAVSGKVGVIPELLQEALEKVKGLPVSLSNAPDGLGDTEMSDALERRNGVSQRQAPNLRLVPADRPRDWVADVLTGVYDEEAPTEVDELMTLSEACDAGVLTLKLPAAKQAAGRQGFPAEVLPRRQQAFGAAAKQYRRSELEDWTRARNARLSVGASHA